MDIPKSQRIDCKKCRHYYITWDKKFPYGCRALGFKTSVMPSLQVFRSSGLPCQYFSEKKKNHK